MCYANWIECQHVTVTAAHIDKSSLVALCDDVRRALLRSAKRSESACAEASCMKEMGKALENFAALVAGNVAFLSVKSRKHCPRCGLVPEPKHPRQVITLNELHWARGGGAEADPWLAFVNGYVLNKDKGGGQCGQHPGDGPDAPQCPCNTIDEGHFAQCMSWHEEKNAPPLVALDLGEAGYERRRMRLYPSGKKSVPLPMVGGVVNVEYELAAVLLYNGAHYVCVVRGDPCNEEPAWVRYDGMSTDGGALGVGSSCVPPDGAHSWGDHWGVTGTLYSRVARLAPDEAKRDEHLAREAAPNAMFAAFLSARDKVGSAEAALAAADAARLAAGGAERRNGRCAHHEVVRLAEVGVVDANAAMASAAALAPQAARDLRAEAVALRRLESGQCDVDHAEQLASAFEVVTVNMSLAAQAWCSER